MRVQCGRVPIHLILLAAAAATLSGGCRSAARRPLSPTPTSTPAAAFPPGFRLTSTVFQEGGTLPIPHTCDGGERPPSLGWTSAPAGTKSFALVMHDPDAPGGDFTHWVCFDIPVQKTSLPVGTTEEASGGVFGTNDRGSVGYFAPCPPPGTGPHHYVFTLYALDVAHINLGSGARRGDVEAALLGHTLGQTRLTALYERK